MNKYVLTVLMILYSASVFAAENEALTEGMENPGFYEKPDWFKQSFLDLGEDIEEANDNQKRVILYFHQDGCPYCKKLLEDNFSRKDIVNKMQRHYELIAINMWGDKTVTSVAGDTLTEKEFAKQMKVMFTPTLVALDSQGAPLFRMNGYYEPEKFSAVLDYLLLFSDTNVSKDKHPNFNEFYRQRAMAKTHSQKQQKMTALPGLHTESFIVQQSNLQNLIENSQRPVLLLFEQQYCAECDELHGDVFRRLPVFKQLKQFTIAQIDINSSAKIITPNGQAMSQQELAKSFNIQYTPSMLFYEPGKSADGKHKPVFRSEAYLKSFHIQALLDYITTRSYLTQPEFQRFVQERADKLHAQGVEFDLWD